MKVRVNLYIDDSLLEKLRKQLSSPPKKSVSSWVEECIDEFLKKQKQA